MILRCRIGLPCPQTSQCQRLLSAYLQYESKDHGAISASQQPLLVRSSRTFGHYSAAPWSCSNCQKPNPSLTEKVAFKRINLQKRTHRTVTSPHRHCSHDRWTRTSNAINPRPCLGSSQKFQQISCFSTSAYRSRETSGQSKRATGLNALPNSLVDDTWARKAVEKMKDFSDLTSSDSVIHDATPGYGALSRALLEAGVRNIVCWKQKPETLKSRGKVPGQVEVVDKVFSVRNLLQQNQTSEGAVKHKKMRVVVGLRKERIMHYLTVLLKLLAWHPKMVSNGDLEHFMFVSGFEVKLMESEEWHISAGHSRRHIYQLFFRTQKLLEIPLDAFWPGMVPAPSKRTEAAGDWDLKCLFLVKLEPRPDLFEIVPANKLDSFLVFIKEFNQRRNERFIAQVEQWIPGMGLMMLDKGYSMMDTFGDINVQDHFDIYKSFLESPNYQNLAFKKELEGSSAPTPDDPLLDKDINKEKEHVDDQRTSVLL